MTARTATENPMTNEHVGDLAGIFRSRYDYFEEMFAKGAIRELVDEFYTDDAVVEGYGMPKQVGKAAITAAFAGARDAGLRTISIKMDEPAQPGDDLAYQFITNDNDFSGRIEVHRALIVWRKTSRGWKCEVDFFCPRS
jgi:ketosteroid isomerase-like protein